MYACNTITFQSFDVGSSLFVCGYISRGYGSYSYMKVIGSRSRSQEQKARNSLFPQCKNSIGNNFGSIEDRAVNLHVFGYGGSNGVTPSLAPSRDRKWPRLNKYIRGWYAILFVTQFNCERATLREAGTVFCLSVCLCVCQSPQNWKHCWSQINVT